MEIISKLRDQLAQANKLTLFLLASALIVLGWLLWPKAEVEEIAFQPDSDAASGSSEISVHLVGAVTSPGLYTLPIGSRVSDALEMAGGFSEQASESSINLARILVDGEQLNIKNRIEHQEEIDSKISINDASAEQLDELPGVGPSIAQKIVKFREQNGPFRSIEAITQVSGIGSKMFANLEDLIRL